MFESSLKPPPTSWNEASNSRPCCWETQWLDISGGEPLPSRLTLHPSITSLAGGLSSWRVDVFKRFSPASARMLLRDPGRYQVKSIFRGKFHWIIVGSLFLICFLVSLDEWHQPKLYAHFMRGNHSRLPYDCMVWSPPAWVISCPTSDMFGLFGFVFSVYCFFKRKLNLPSTLVTVCDQKKNI